MIEGHNATIRHGPLSESKLITVGEQPMIALYRVNKVRLLNMYICKVL